MAIVLVVESTYDLLFIKSLINKYDQNLSRRISRNSIVLHGKDKLERRKYIDLYKIECYRGNKIVFVLDGDYREEETHSRITNIMDNISKNMRKKCNYESVIIGSEIEEWVVIGICGRVRYGEKTE